MWIFFPTIGERDCPIFSTFMHPSDLMNAEFRETVEKLGKIYIFAIFLFFYTISFLGNFYFAFFELYMFWEFFILRELLLTFFYLNCTKLLSYEQTIRKIFRNTPIVVRNNVTWSLRWRVFRTQSPLLNTYYFLGKPTLYFLRTLIAFCIP